MSEPNLLQSPDEEAKSTSEPSQATDARLSPVMVRLLTHNLLACHARGCTSNNFPLVFSDDVQTEIVETEMNEEFLRNFLPKIDWAALVGAAKQLGDTSLPEMGPDPSNPMIDEGLLEALHHVLLEIHVQEGSMVCPNCKHVYQIKSGIPNMLLAEHEVSK